MEPRLKQTAAELNPAFKLCRGDYWTTFRAYKNNGADHPSKLWI